MEDRSIKPYGKKREIIEAARDVFSRYGYKKTTMDDVASSLNITRSALYHYYKNKDDLFVEVAEFLFMKYKIELEEAVSAATTIDEKFKALCRCYLISKKDFRNIFKIESDEHPFSFEIYKKLKALSTSIHVDIIEEILREDPKIAKITNLGYFSTLLIYSIRGITFNASDIPIEQLESNIHKLCEIFYYGLSAASQDNS